MSSEFPSPNDEPVEAPENEVEDVPEELSLAQLSQAYAQVMKEQGQLPDSADDDQPLEIPIEANESEPPLDNQSNSRTAQKSIDEIDADDNAGCPISPKSIVEAMLFVGSPAEVNLTGRKLAAAIRDVSPQEIKKIVKELNGDYERQNSSFRIVCDSGDYKMKLHEDMIDVQNHYFGRNRPARLSQNAIDVLAVVAYNQPVSRIQVDKIRSKSSGTAVTQLLRRGLIAPVEDSKENQLHTTDRFLELFGLGTLEDLPQTSVISDLEELTDI